MRVDHIAIKTKNLAKMQDWYEKNLGALLETKDTYYVRLKMDNTIISLIDYDRYQYSHLGIFVNEWKDLPANGVRTTHRDGTIGVYCFDPEGNVIEYIWYPDKTEATMSNESKRQSVRRRLCQKIYDWGSRILGGI